MARYRKSPEHRLEVLRRSKAPSGGITLFAARKMYAGIGGVTVPCTVSGHRRTRVFDFPGAVANLNCGAVHFPVLESAHLRASITSSLVEYFGEASSGDHYALSPSLRHVVDEVSEQAQQSHRAPLFVVIEENDELERTELNGGECCEADEVRVESGEQIPILPGGRIGERFLAAWRTIDGAWPELPDDHRRMHIVMAGVRAVQQHAGPIRKHLDQRCLIADDGRFVDILWPYLSAGVISGASPLDHVECAQRTSEVRRCIEAMDQATGNAPLELLARSLYCDDARDDSYQQLLYLHLWQSVKDAQVENRLPSHLVQYRHDIAHGHTERMDAKNLAELQKAVSQHIRDTYC